MQSASDSFSRCTKQIRHAKDAKPGDFKQKIRRIEDSRESSILLRYAQKVPPFGGNLEVENIPRRGFRSAGNFSEL